jgi:hypothetical protein
LPLLSPRLAILPRTKSCIAIAGLQAEEIDEI